MRLTISHSTTYSYDSPDHYALQQLRLRPKTGAGQRVIEWSTEISGGIKQLSYDDHHDNHVDLVVIEKDAMEITITSRGVVEVEDQMGVVGRMRGLSPMWLFESPTEVTEPGPGLRRLAKAVIGAQKTIGLEQLHHLSAAILADVRYDKGQTDATLVAEAALAAGQARPFAVALESRLKRWNILVVVSCPVLAISATSCERVERSARRSAPATLCSLLRARFAISETMLALPARSP